MHSSAHINSYHIIRHIIKVIMNEDFHGEVDENIFHDLVADDISDPNTEQIFQTCKVADKVQDSKVHKEWWLLTHEKFTKIFWWENWISRQSSWCMCSLSGNTTN